MSIQAKQNSNLKVLLVEDSVSLQRLLLAMLNEIPCVEIIAAAETEAAALELCRSTSPDLAIVDLTLQVGNGLNVLRILKEANSFTAPDVVIFSNQTNLIIRHRCLSLGATAFFDKSFQIEDLLEYVQLQASHKSQRLQQEK